MRTLARMFIPIVILGAAMPAAGQPGPAEQSARPTMGQAVAKLKAEAAALREFVRSPLARSFVSATEVLAEVGPVQVLIDRANRKYYTPKEAEALPEADRARLEPRQLDEQFFYNTKYGSPLAYSRALDVLATCGHPKAMTSLARARVLDFGYGGIGHLTMMAVQPAHVVGVDVDPLLVAYYSQHDPGYFGLGATVAPIGSGNEGAASTGNVRLVNGHWPGEENTARLVGDGYDLFISKNTLKRGYIHPEREADPRMLIDLGVTDEQYLAKLHEILNPGGWVLIYNLCPAPAAPDKPYIPWADGRCPFTEEAIRAAGFEIVVYDRDDSEQARRMGDLLGWDDTGMKLETDLFAWVTLLRKPDAK